MAKQIFQTLLGFAALSIVVGAAWIGLTVAQDYEFNIHYFMIILAIIISIYASNKLGEFILKGKK